MSAKYCECGAQPQDGRRLVMASATDWPLLAFVSFGILSESELGQPERESRLAGKTEFCDNLLTSLGWPSGLDAKNLMVDN